jgi:hypothetical protein
MGAIRRHISSAALHYDSQALAQYMRTITKTSNAHANFYKSAACCHVSWQVIGLKVLVGPVISDDDLNLVAQARAKKAGLFRGRPQESVRITRSIPRRFRTVSFLDSSGDCIGTSLLDMKLSHLVRPGEDAATSMLLWRPRYAGLPYREIEASFRSNLVPDDPDHRAFLEEFILARKQAQRDLVESRKDFAKVEKEWKSATSLLIPRAPSRLAQHEEAARKKREADSWTRAFSMVMNCSEESAVENHELGDVHLVMTRLIIYSDLNSEKVRMVAAENPSATSVEDALSKGRALTRLCEIDEDCFRAVMKELVS